MQYVNRGTMYVSSYRWLGLACILVLYVVAVLRLHPTNFFGLTEDDSIYFSSAKALAEGKGYILPSIPGTPAATKYPILYSWLLSWVWRWNPSFPGNLADGVALNIALGCGFITATFLFFCQSRFGSVEGLLLTLFCALHPTTLLHSGSLLADIPFAALMLSAIVAANRALRRDPGIALAGVSGILTGLSVLVRMLGAPVAAGIFVAMLMRRAWRRAVVFAACAMPFFAGPIWRAVVSLPQRAPLGPSGCSSTWRGTWIFYTSYIGHWKLVMLQDGVFWQMLKTNALLLLLQPGMYFVDPHFISPFLLGVVLSILLSAAAVAGIFRYARREGYEAIHFALAFYAVPILLWIYPLTERFLLPFLPLMATGLWTEGSDLVNRIQKTLQGPAPRAEKQAAVFLSMALLALGVGIGWSYRETGKVVALESQLRGSLLPEKREAYVWLEQKTAPDAKAIAYEDASLFLYSGREALRPVIFSPGGAFDLARLKTELRCISASARAIDADYWVIADDDFGIERAAAVREGYEREKEIERVLPLAFRSQGGHVRIYGLGCVQRPEDPSCQSADRVLFPVEGLSLNR